MAGTGGDHGESTGAILAAFLANMGIAVTKFIGFLITGSSSLLAKAIDEAETAIRDQVPIATRIYIEPDFGPAG